MRKFNLLFQQLFLWKFTHNIPKLFVLSGNHHNKLQVFLSQRFFTSTNGWFRNDNHDINKAVLEAEKIIGYRTSYLSLHALFSDELTSVALHVKKLAASKHPLLTTARGILFDSEHSVQARGIVVLLLSKLLLQNIKFKAQLDMTKTIKLQQSLAELTELIYVGILIHRGIIDRRYMSQLSESLSKIEVGNKMSVLSGDFLFSNACIALSELENSKVVSLMSTAIGNMSQGCFVLPESSDSFVINAIGDLPCCLNDWRNVTYLSHASLLSHACRSSAELLGEGARYGDACARFGENMVLAQQARADIDRMKGKVGEKVVPLSLELCALPVVIVAQEQGGTKWLRRFLYEREQNHWVISREKLASELRRYPSAFVRAEEVRCFHARSAVDALLELPDGDARLALRNFALALAA